MKTKGSITRKVAILPPITQFFPTISLTIFQTEGRARYGVAPDLAWAEQRVPELGDLLLCPGGSHRYH